MTFAGSYRYRCEPAGTVIRAFGGARKCGAAIGVSAELCSQWNRPADRGGTGGWIPEKHRPALLAAAKKRGLKSVTKDLLASGKREEPDVGMMSRRKGAKFELDVVKDLVAAGLRARKVPLSGAAAEWPGDVVIHHEGKEWVLQCKISADGGGRQSILRVLREVALCRVIAGSARLVAMRREQFVDLVKGRAARAVNTPEITIAGRQVLDHIDGHDALVFRRDGSTEWMAIVREEMYR
jgi:hypothetical protein